MLMMNLHRVLRPLKKFISVTGKMLPTGDEADNMEQSTMNYVFNLFGKGVTQMLQQMMNQQTVIDELRATNRSLQTQVANLTASLDEVEDRIFVRLQNMQPTIYTREGIPIDDALDTLATKMQTVNEKLMTNAETFAKLDAELSAKIDRDEFIDATADNQRVSETVSDLTNSVQYIQREVTKVKQEMEDSQDRMLKTIRLQAQSSSMRGDLSGESHDMANFVTRDELNHAISRVKIMAESIPDNSNAVQSSAIVEFALSEGSPSEEKMQNAFDMLQQKKAQLEKSYAAQHAQIAKDMERLVRIAENGKPEETAELEEEEIEDYDEYEEDDVDFVPPQAEKREYREVGLGTNGDLETGAPHSKDRKIAGKRRNIGLTVNIKVDDKGQVQKHEEELEEFVEDVEEETTSRSKKKKRSTNKSQQAGASKTPKAAKTKSTKSRLIDEMKKEQASSAKTAKQANQNQPANVRVDEGKITQKVMEAIMPRIENLLVDTLSTGSSNGSGVKLEKHEAKQLVDQLSLLDSMKSDIKTLKTKIAMKIDKGRVESELKLRITREELLGLLQSLFPENENVKRVAPLAGRTRLPPLGNRSQSEASAVKAVSQSHGYAMTYGAGSSLGPVPGGVNSGATMGATGGSAAAGVSGTGGAGGPSGASSSLAAGTGIIGASDGQLVQSQKQTKTGQVQIQKGQGQGRMTLRPARNSNMIALNNKFLRGADGHYYLRDLGSEQGGPGGHASSMFGTDNPNDVEINAAFDFQPFQAVDTASVSNTGNVQLMNMREKTPMTMNE